MEFAMKLRNLALLMLRPGYAFLLTSPMGRMPIIFRGIYPVVYAVVYTVWGFLWPKFRRNPVLVDGGLLYLVDSCRIGFSVDLSLYGVYEEGTTCLFKELVEEGQTVVDLGAHVGYFTLLAAARVGKTGKVFAFEPEPPIYSLLVKNVEVNGYENVIPVKKAVSNETGVTKLFLPKTECGGSTIFNPKGGGKSVPVDVVTLDEFFRDRETPIHLVKMDIEGAEMAALEGMANIIERNDNLKVITEFLPGMLIRDGVSPTGFLDIIEDYGFRIYIIDEKEKCTQPVTAAQALKICNHMRKRNLLLVKGSQWPSD